MDTIKEQSKVDGACDVSLYQFDDEYETALYKIKDIFVYFVKFKYNSV